MGVVIGNGNGGFPTTEDGARVLFERGGMKLSPFFIPMILPNMAAANVRRLFGLKGYPSTVITACAAGNQGLGEGTKAIRWDAGALTLAGRWGAGVDCIVGFSACPQDMLPINGVDATPTEAHFEIVD